MTLPTPAATLLRITAEPASPLLVEVTRGAMVESIHRGRAVAVGRDGTLLAAFGDVEALVYPRSSNKALQALPLVESGAADAFGLGDAELALACASHNGEPMHTERVAAWLSRIGLSVADLECGGHAPYHAATWEAMLRRGEGWSALHNNCSGKHSGFLSTAVHLGEPTRGYTGYDHPVQQRLRAVQTQMMGVDLSSAPWGVDGCSIPTVGVPLRALALGMARLADPSGLPDRRAEAIRRITRAWGRHPELVSGTDTFDTGFMQAVGSRFLSKMGAEGLCCMVAPQAGVGVAVKIDDGNGRAAGPAAAAVLRRLGLLDDATWAGLSSLVGAPVKSRLGVVVGQIESCF